MKRLLPLLLLALLVGCAPPPLEEVPAPAQPSVTTPVPLPDVLPEPEPAPIPEPEPAPEPITLHILGAGDNLIHTGIFLQGARRAGGNGYDFTYTYENVADRIATADFASINQECVMANMSPSAYPRFNAPQEIGDALIDIGFDLISLSNNHMFDKGEDGLRDTIDFLRGKDDLLVTGAYYDQADYENIPTWEQDGITLAVVSATQPTNGLSLPASSPLVVPLILDTGVPTRDNPYVQALIAQTQRAAEQSDVVVANIHWGSEYTHTPSDFQRQVATLLVEAGATIIYGHHPHVIQPVEYITRADGSRGVVCYSLGNFISCQDRGARMVGGLMDAAVTKESDGSITVGDVVFSPVITHYGSNFSNVTTYPYDQYTPELASAHGVRVHTSAFSCDYIYALVTDVIDPAFLPQDFLDQYAPTP